MGEEEIIISKAGALIACGGMSLLYVAVLYSPTLVFGRPPPSSYKQFLLRRFICAAVSSLLCLLLSSLLLFPVQGWSMTTYELAAAHGIRTRHFCRALLVSFSLTCLIYAGSLLLKFAYILDSWTNGTYAIITSAASDISAWRNLVVAPITEELVFRACMVPLLLCGGFKPQIVVFLCPVFFSLAHLNHLLDFYSRKDSTVLKASMAVGTQLAYTMVFGSYASFLFIRTGHLIAPLVAHIVCNFMGLPAVYSKRKGGLISLAFIAGTLSFLWLLVPLTSPALYFRTYNCRCWHGYCIGN